ncbi:hypothetical protein Asp14428_10640 [Actinoplanes sp. NBRC 14428]|uniref:Calcineurin-like phosphoesterase family protein n=1 Tax=Pseudosporangium ferrugineum TaxID=439699 RepID=A0A2T0SFH4_9ACTN|nr:metallophosphoesterase [Pseudosporangium ferrugineum]PRY32168.1 calcineurin-like phosphoesterase family protein [Pseudosporangium ferrugineum]BCJ49589.1 hypothetical protein Asp14428_10640 [Actinoplanes sp. NBRC 14428]
MISRRRAAARYGLAVLLVLVLVLVWLLSRCSAEPTTIRMAAVGDMACDPDDPDFDRTTKERGDLCRHQAVSDLAVAMDPDVLLGLGDFQYELPAAEAYRTVYGPSFGRLLDRTVPVFGNQEYKVQDANTFTAYFGDRIGDPRGYWSQDLGKWHLVVLNSNCAAVAGGCGAGSPQQTWLAQDLAENDRRCVIAAWHHPRWSTGIAGSDVRTADLFDTLYDHEVELVLSGHEADYERFGPLNPQGRPDTHGVRQYVIGTGGQAHYLPGKSDATRDERGDPLIRTDGPSSEYADFDHHGVLELVLAPDSWTWRFHPLEAGRPVTDEGRASCH